MTIFQVTFFIRQEQAPQIPELPALPAKLQDAETLPVLVQGRAG